MFNHVAPDTCTGTGMGDFNISGAAYMWVKASKTWEEANAGCRQHGMELAALASQSAGTALHAAVAPYLAGSALYWLGGSDGEAEAGWSWSDGSIWSWTNWGADQPDGSTDENCLAVPLTADGSNGNVWHNKPCSQLGAFVCKSTGEECEHIMVGCATFGPL